MGTFRHSIGCRRFGFVLLSLVVLYLLLLIPAADPTVLPGAMTTPFRWDQDARWDSLETAFASARRAGCESLSGRMENGMEQLRERVSFLESHTFAPPAPTLGQLEESLFSLAPLVAACPSSIGQYMDLFSRVRIAVKHQSEQWDMNDRSARETLYRLLYGGRQAIEEVILQLPREQYPQALTKEVDEPSATPSADLLGVRIHSGDILVSRGGAPTSALIARGNDFSGNFSHIALAYVDEKTGKLSIIESHIERGVAVATPRDYLQDTKLRVMVLRLRTDLPALVRDPMLPHRAAAAMLRRARTEHIPYDFSMDYQDSAALFCSEVASSAYMNCGVRLWTGMSHISSPGLRAWLADFGVTHFETQEPSDLEYDPQLRVVAEWRDGETLHKDHIDNAVTEAMLENAEKGDRLRYTWYMLPIARSLKAYSSILNLFGGIGPVPEGMSAASALKHRDYSERHADAVATVKTDVRKFQASHEYEPPYWELLRMARTAVARE